jgi:GrpB-like predicted nucleotidyltransferase (UPF0157 family)
VSEPVDVIEWSSEWPKQFERYARRLSDAVGSLALAIEHVGSTAVPGLPAKPVIDIDVVLRRDADVAEAVRRLARVGYRHEGDVGIPGREAFAWPPCDQRHHVYVVVVDNAAHAAHLLFRDYLRAHPGTAREYGELKRRLADAHAADRAAYTEGKTRFVERVLAAATSGADLSRTIE